MRVKSFFWGQKKYMVGSGFKKKRGEWGFKGGFFCVYIFASIFSQFNSLGTNKQFFSNSCVLQSWSDVGWGLFGCHMF